MKIDLITKFSAGDAVWTMYGSVPRRGEIERIEYSCTETNVTFGENNKGKHYAHIHPELKYSVRVADAVFNVDENMIAHTFEELRDIVFNVEENEYF